MPFPVAALPGSAVSLDALAPTTPPPSELDRDAFLKLLVTQLRYQDPLDPTSPENFIAQTAQFTQVERLDQIAEQGAGSLFASMLTTASALVGREVEYFTADGTIESATVVAAEVGSTDVLLRTADGELLELTQILSIGDPEPVPDEPVPDEPVPDEPVPDEPVPDEPVPDEPVPDEPVPDEPVPDEPAPDEPAPQPIP